MNANDIAARYAVGDDAAGASADRPAGISPSATPGHPGAAAVVGQGHAHQVPLVRGEQAPQISREALLALDLATVDALHPEPSEGRKAQPDVPVTLTAEAGAEDAPSLTSSPGTGAAVPSATVESPAAARVDAPDLASTPGALSAGGAHPVATGACADATSGEPGAAGGPSSSASTPSNVLSFKTREQREAERAERRKLRAENEERQRQHVAEQRVEWSRKVELYHLGLGPMPLASDRAAPSTPFDGLEIRR